MSDAIIIPFPGRPPVQTGQERLQTALEHLQTALDDQRKALSDWRFAMTELGIGVAGLCHSLASYQGALGEVDEKLSGLHTQAVSLEAWADGKLGISEGSA